MTYARLVLPPGESAWYSDNDLVLICKNNPIVRMGNRLFKLSIFFLAEAWVFPFDRGVHPLESMIVRKANLALK